MKRFMQFDHFYLERKAKPDKTIREHTQDLLDCFDTLCRLGYVKDEAVRRFTQLAIYFHDHGKANHEFGQRIESKKRFNPQREVGHNLLSVMMMDPKVDYFSINDTKERKKAFAILQYAVLNHHHYVDNLKEIQNEQIKAIAEANLAGLPYFPLNNRMVQRIGEAKELPCAVMTTGLLHKCDYAASSSMKIEYVNDFLEEHMERLLRAWQVVDQEAGWNELQEYCRCHREENLIVTAPTGMGKTEAGLHWIGKDKGFFVLPLRTAINAMFTRIRDGIIQNEKVDERLALLHSDTLGVYNHMGNDLKMMQDQDWNVLDYYKHSKRLSLPLSISTPDQLFDFVFKEAAYELKLATLAYSKIVIDEIQAYNAELLAYLLYGIHRIYGLGGKFCILTATLPPFIRDLLKHPPDIPEIKAEEKDFSDKGDVIRHFLMAKENELTGQEIIEVYREHCAQGKRKKLLIVCNTIRKAQEIYQTLQGAEIENVYMLHSKFTKADRRGKETNILEDGLTYSKGTKDLNERSVIWVSTSLVEASLDLDFDELFTELSDLSGLFQRLGRCNRKGIKTVSMANCFVYLTIDKNLLNDGGEKGFIDKKIHELSKEAIRHWNGVITESDKQQLINTYLTTDRIEEGSQSSYLKKYREHYDFVKNLNPEEFKFELSHRFRNIISYTVIPETVYEENTEKIHLMEDALKNIEESFQEDCQKSSSDTSKMTRADREQKILNRIRWREKLMEYTVDVGLYDIYYSGAKAKNKVDAIKGKIELGKNEEILIIEGHYDQQLGFRRLSKEERSSGTQEPVELEVANDMFI